MSNIMWEKADGDEAEEHNDDDEVWAFINLTGERVELSLSRRGGDNGAGHYYSCQGCGSSSGYPYTELGRTYPETVAEMKDVANKHAGQCRGAGHL